MADEAKIPPPPAFTSEIQEQERQQKDVNRLQRLPPLEYERMNRDQRLVFIQWYQQTAVCREMLERYPKDSLDSIFATYPTEEPADTPLKESLLKSFQTYSQQAWSSEGKQPPQPASYFLFHKRFSRLIDQGIYLPAHKDMVPALLFSLEEVNQIHTQGLQSIVTAVGSQELHFHEEATVYPNDKETLYIYLRQNARYFHRANTEFMKQETTEVWFRRTIEGIPQFIFCPAVSAKLPLLAFPLSFPLSTPGMTEVVLELSRLEAMPALHFDECGAEHKNDFYQWLSTNVKSHIRDEEAESLKLAARLIRSFSNDFNVAKPRMLKDEVASLYEKYAQEMWSMPSKQLPKPQSIYLFEKKFQETDRYRITFPSELMQQALTLVLTTKEVDQLFRSKVLSVKLSVTTSTRITLERQSLLEVVETSCRTSCLDGMYNDIFSQLISDENFEVWFLRIQTKPKFIIIPRQNRP